MHVILGALGTIVTILILLNRLAEAGIDLGGLNPFLWHRRRKWQNLYDGDPIFKLNQPMDVTALLMVGVAKSDGDMSSEEKHGILNMFQSEFHLSKRDASDLMIASVHLLKDGADLKTNLPKVITPSLDTFTQEQMESAVSLIKRVAAIDGEQNEMRNEMVHRIVKLLNPIRKAKGKWN